MATDPVHGDEAAQWGGWTWREPRRGEHFRRCSYCGSINPDDLAAEPTWRASWADRKYGWPHKFYVDVPNRDPERKFIISAHRGDRLAVSGQGWTTADEVPEDVITDGWLRDGERLADRFDVVQLDTRAHHHAKFYTAHLADPRLGSEVKDAIERRSGLRFHFQDGTVRWEAATAPAEGVTIPNIEQLAQAAYAAYGEHTGGVNYAGLPMPAWEDLGDTIRGAWIAATKAVADRVTESEK